ncbi:MAG: orange carotenoid protein N-terminal domain-containing protein [Nostoc sp. DedVER02]|uniref:orange carotenoid protein N-terminal domain-containing protein n=1 Tax=unclassified Nostoc TaxID=2593658 RepID=UPI002AD38102|nr:MULTISPECIES: orange carotenoid protein N-terminal domain-containing protein [unclassified Nostoc]MDZ7984814.1 orange carotenoid protein N-terminal domain-containing protein [Nostoc sp. DedVER02]MDZ8115297.1 orange carotenoid protein N-terminal domain-containing protein [Nostoc sp. DedVER01b]
MTSTNVNFLEQSVSKFQSLDTDDRLTVLALLYTEIGDEIPSLCLNNTPNEQTANLVAQIQNLPQQEQVPALRQLLNQNEVGETAIPTEEYASMNAEDKLGFWYQLAQNLGTTIIGVPDDHIPSEKATEVVDLLHTPNIEDLVTFFKRVL